MNLLFSNFYEEYMIKIKKIEDVESSIMDKIGLDSSKAYEFSVLYHSQINSKNDNYYTSSITFVLNTSNDYIFDTILDHFKYQSASQFFRDLINEYLAYPQYKREQIIFKESVDILQQAITDQEQIKLHLDKDIVTIYPYRLDTSKEELYTYLIGIKDGKPYSINISKINLAIRTLEPYSFTEDQIKLMDEIIENGIQFPYQEPCHAVIKLNKIGKKLYERRYLHRPPVQKIEGDNYYFSCGFEHLLFYFLAFGKNALVLSPQSLENNMKYEHLNAFKQYR